MVREDHSGLLEDSRFKEIKNLKKKHLPHNLHWFLKEDYFSNELLGLYPFEVDKFKQVTSEAFALFERATEKILRDRELHLLGIPSFFEECIRHSWEHRNIHKFLLGRFDINGGFGHVREQVIEFNADTCSTIPETIDWQSIQLEKLGPGKMQCNDLKSDLVNTFNEIARQIPKEMPVILGSSFGYEEDVINVNTVLQAAHDAGLRPFYQDLEHVIFSEEEGIFYKIGNEYEQVDIWFKMIPWDWMFTEEPELARLLSKIITNNLCVVLNPPYTTLWQNKKFLAYITKHFPNNAIAETFIEGTTFLEDYVKKPVYGRIGENITIKAARKEEVSKGDYGNQDTVLQRYVPLAKDEEDYYYQVGMFYTTRPSALNLRTQESKIITDDCEFMTHFYL